MAIAASTFISVLVPPLNVALTHVTTCAMFTFHVLENAQMTLSNVPNTAMLTGTARTSVGTRPRQKTRPPDSAYILCAVRHDEPRRPVSLSAPIPMPVPVPVPVIVPACKRVLRTSKGNVAIQPIIPAAAPATSGGAQARGRLCGSATVSVSSKIESGWWCGCAGPGTGAGVGCIGVVGAKRRSVPSYCWCFCCMELFLGEGWGESVGCTHSVEV
jgi:hypothetical protein